MLYCKNGDDGKERLKRSPRLDEHRGMKIHSRDILTTTRARVPQTVVRSKSYRRLVGQWFLGPCGSNEYHNESIVEEDESADMVEGGPSNELYARAARSDNREINGGDWRAEEEFSSDKEDDEEVEQAGFRDGAPIPASSGVLDPPEIKVTVDTSLHQMAQDYCSNFSGFAEINRFGSIEEMHDFIKKSLDASGVARDSPSSKQVRYLNLLLKEKPADRFRRLFQTSSATVRRVLARNEHILRELFVSASLEDFPSPFCSILAVDEGAIDDSEDDSVDGTSVDEEDENVEIQENMKRWYMIEMIGLWLRMITDVRSYREAIKKNVLMKSCGIENDRYDGIAVPLKYK